MTNAAITIQNELTTAQSLDIKISEDLVIRNRLSAKGVTGDSIDVGDITTLDELNRNPQVRALLDASTPKISISVTAGTTDVPGSDSQTAVVNSEGLGGLERIVADWAAGAAGGNEDRVIVAAMPFGARIVDTQVMVSTAGTAAATATLRDATAGGGSALSDDLDVSTAAVRVRDTGTSVAGVVPSVSKGDPLVLRLGTNSDSAGTVIIDLQRLS